MKGDGIECIDPRNWIRSKDSSSIVTEGRQRSVSQTIRYRDVVMESVNVLTGFYSLGGRESRSIN